MKFLGLEISKKMFIGIIASVAIAGGGITTGVILTSNKDDAKQEETQKENIKAEEIILKENLDLEINSEVNLLSLVSDNNKVEIISKDEKIDTSVLGEKELVIKYKDNDKEKEQSFKVKVIDTIKPTIESKKELSTTVGKKIDLLKNVKATDNSKEDIKVVVEGDYDLSKVGTYNLKYVAIDSSNNKGEEEFVLNVTKKTTSSNTSSTKPSSNTSNKNNGNSKDIFITSGTNNYQFNYTYDYVKKTDNLIPKNKQDILNIIFTALNQGAEDFQFKCDSTCAKNFQELFDGGYIANIKNYLHPYNSFRTLSYGVAPDQGDMFIGVSKTYSDSEITKIENKVNSIMKSKVTSSLSLNDKIKVLHDYLVENISYAPNNMWYGDEFTAVGSLINGEATNDGYAHATSIFLYKLNIPNYRIFIPKTNMWNLAYVNGKWQHIDVAWDDKIGNNGETKHYDFLLVDSNVIKSQDKNNEHNFDKNFYKEAQ